MKRTRHCNGKIRFPLLCHAERAAERMRDADKRVTVYPCQECDGWHVGGKNLAGWRRRPMPRNVQIAIGGLE